MPAGMYATYSKWIPIEIVLARQQGKPIVAVRKYAAERSSQLVTDNSNQFVGWNGKSIADAIKRWHG